MLLPGVWDGLAIVNIRPIKEPSFYIPHLEGREDLVSRLIVGIIKVTKWFIGVIILLAKSPDPPSI